MADKVRFLDESGGGYRHVYIGDLNDPKFKWEGGDWSHNTPARLSPFFPNGYNAFNSVAHWIYMKRLVGKQTDFCAWVGKATKAQLREFIHEEYDNHSWRKQPEWYPDFPREIEELLEYVESLEDGVEYALVASGFD